MSEKRIVVGEGRVKSAYLFVYANNKGSKAEITISKKNSSHSMQT